MSENDGFDLQKALGDGVAWTRDGRMVSGLCQATLSGEPVLFGFIQGPGAAADAQGRIPSEMALWAPNGASCHPGAHLTTTRPAGAERLRVLMPAGSEEARP